MNPNDHWSRSFQDWRNGRISIGSIQKQLRLFKRIGIDLNLIKSDLASLHNYLDSHLLNPRYLPISLLLEPTTWNPLEDGIQKIPLLLQHRHLSSINELLVSGTLNQILNGHLSLYGDLPPIPIGAYEAGLNKTQRQIRRTSKISLLEHLATEGWDHFRRQESVATGLDRYHPTKLPTIKSFVLTTKHLLLVIDGTTQQAQSLAVVGGWNDVVSCSLAKINSLPNLLRENSAEWITICHASDILANGALHALAEQLQQTKADTVLTCDDIIVYQLWNDGLGYEHRQYRSSVSAIRLCTRGGIGGLLTLPYSLLKRCKFAPSYTCLEALRLDILLQTTRDPIKTTHCHIALVKHQSSQNPSIPEQGWPRERCPLSDQQLDEIGRIRSQHAKQYFGIERGLKPNPLQAGCHDLSRPTDKSSLVSILIPFRDRVELTRACVDSIKLNAGKNCNYEIILIDNGSEKHSTKEWVRDVIQEDNIQCIRLDEEFNYSRINNKARQSCRGDFLLFLNNDIEFISGSVLNALLDPFAHPKTVAVGSRLNYPDGSIQHQGVVIIPGERRCVLEPGKHLNEQEVIASLLPLRTQEEFSAASAACLMVKAEWFDFVGGFDEKLAVVFNDVDLCLRLRDAGGSVVVTPHATITHYESISRGKDQVGFAWARHQRESGRLRLKHKKIYAQGDPLISPLLHHHSTRYEPVLKQVAPLRPAREEVLLTWRRPARKNDKRIPLIFAQYASNNDKPIRSDILDLLRKYRRYFYVQVVAATPSLLHHPRELTTLRSVCDGLIIRRNEGYDFGSWMTGLRFCRDLIDQRQSVLLSNDSFWGPIRPLTGLINRLSNSQADVIGLTDNLMYEPHLQSAFLMFKRRAVSCPSFWQFWDNIMCWDEKRSIVKNYEVGLSVLLKENGMTLESLYSKNANGNILHAEWKSLIEDHEFPFIKVSLLRDNPHEVDIRDWKETIRRGNRRLARQIENYLEELKRVQQDY